MAAPLLLLLLLLLGALLVPSAARPSAANASDAPTAMEVRLGVLLPERNLGYPWAWPRVSPALDLALEALQPELSNAGLSVRAVFIPAQKEDSNRCEEIPSQFEIAELKSAHNLDLLVGLSCWQKSEASIGQFWLLPLLTAGLYHGNQDHFTTTEVYAGPLRPYDVRAFQAQLHRHFNWTASAVLVAVDREGAYWEGEFRPFLSALQKPLQRKLPYFILRHHEYHQRDEAAALQFIKVEGRVAYIFGSLETLQEIMRLAHAQNMTNGDYVFIYLDLFGESLRAEGHREAAKPWQSKEAQDTGVLREAFQTVLVITAHEPQTPEYQRFQRELILRAQRDFGVAINDSMGHLVAGCFHDGLLLYLRTLIETLHEGGTKEDTSRILKKMRSLKFQGVTGIVSIKSKNTRETDFDLWAMKDVKNGEYQVVGHFIAMADWINWTGTVHWKNGGPPLDNPPCVFNIDDPSCDPLTVLTAEQPVQVCRV